MRISSPALTLILTGLQLRHRLGPRLAVPTDGRSAAGIGRTDRADRGR